ncbi:response regulator [Actinacidiphila yeochonensis]|uniref:response regulator n=1 Tax=Actinacidiphila yeochonensis TaxID=89050 RepID=UPI00055DDF18|nr:response regulator transcription factor [Actinacidiphila yeochonensis]
MTTTVLLADDQALLRATFRLLIDSAADLTVVAEAANGAEAATEARVHRPDVVLMDIRMPGTDGLAATEAICSDPDLARTRVLILTTFETDEYVARALRAGASGFLGKDAGPDTLLDGIRTVAAGDALLSPTATRHLIATFLEGPVLPSAAAGRAVADLTPRESEITTLVAEGLTNDEIATRLTLSPLTVRTHVQRALTKTGSRDRAQLVALAYRTGLIRPPA